MIVRFFKGGLGACLAIPAACLLVVSFAAIGGGKVLLQVAEALWSKAFELLEVDDD
jgi:hypothetical protein